MTNDSDPNDSDPKDSDKSEGDQPVAASSAEDVKRKFREALDRKHAHGGRDVSEDGEHAKIHDAHGPAKAQQMFRRKSGG
jgi:Family of unknown function (DUF5302)